ncbi:TrmH family RNA methyltransferase [Aeromicrobium sp.]|uniref:TrmH family RNA methyltransferase n=1 Tax=Aeromicrobium sp. TaxID=1871063 RepID=UPI0025BECEED|nr:TrmH family RNA methyltransferase [Aeromicrobium sp.]MCK5891055.1 rRNA methyltransferase [Aeromicrobium sp.]
MQRLGGADEIVHTRNATFQQWRALLANRTKRHRQQSFLVQGVRPLTIAFERAWPMRMLLGPLDRDVSDWAADAWSQSTAPKVLMPGELLDELGEKADVTELVGVAQMPADDPARLLADGGPIVVIDRPTQPRNLGMLARSIDAFGGAGLVVTGYAADPYDPQAVRASTGSLLAVPVLRADGPEQVQEWFEPGAWQYVGTDETGERELRELDLVRPTVLVLGNETRGMSSAWWEACDTTVALPIVGSASSLNVAVTGSIVLHEALRQRIDAGVVPV